MIVTVGFFIIMDWWTEVLRHIPKQLLLETRGYGWIRKAQNKSTKITFTIFKFISLYLWLVLSHSVYEMAVENGFVTCDRNYRSSRFSYFNQNIFSSPYYTFWFREFISIGENIKAIYGKAPYLFTLEKNIWDIAI
jgi:hypothetical protein